MNITPSLQGEVALITEGNKGIGKAIALALTDEGVRLALGAPDEGLNRTACEIQTTSRADAIAVKANITLINGMSLTVDAYKSLRLW